MLEHMVSYPGEWTALFLLLILVPSWLHAAWVYIRKGDK